MLSSFERSCDGEEWEKEKIQGKGERRTIIYHSQEQGGDRTGDSVFDSGPCQKIHFFFSTMHMAQRRDGVGAFASRAWEGPRSKTDETLLRVGSDKIRPIDNSISSSGNDNHQCLLKKSP